MPRVSVIIPTYRRADVLPRAIRSVLAQTLPPAEVIVVDDGSGDQTAEVARAFHNVRVLQQPNCGPVAARNRGLREVTSADFVASLDHDDEWDETFLETAVQALELHGADFACVNFRQTGPYAFADHLQVNHSPIQLLPRSAGSAVLLERATALEFFFFSNGPGSNSALVLRRAAFRKAGWDERAQVADDLLLISRLLLEDRAQCVILTQPLWTKHEDSASFSNHSEETLRRCLHDADILTGQIAGRLSARDLRRWRRRVTNHRYKLAYHCLWNSGTGAAWREFLGALRYGGITLYAQKLIMLAIARKFAQFTGVRA